MKQEDAKRYVWSCLRKTAFRTSAKAKQAAEKALKERGVTLYVYWCNKCGMFHLTSRPPRNDREERNRVY